MDSLIYFGQYVRQQRLKNGMSQKMLSQKIFNKPNPEYIRRLERGSLEGMTFATCDKILLSLDLERVKMFICLMIYKVILRAWD